MARHTLEVLLFTLLLSIVPAKMNAQCNLDCDSILDEGPSYCTGSGDCNSSYELEFCSRGCVCGTCNNHGGSGNCCGKIYYSAVIYANGEQCTGQLCGEARIHALAHLNRRTAQDDAHSAELGQGYSPGLIMLTEQKSYRESFLAYGYSRCSHSYKLVSE